VSGPGGRAAETPAPRFEDVRGAVEETGLDVRGAFHPGPGDGVPAGRNGLPCRTLVLAGNVGSRWWAAFERSAFPGRSADPVDDWSRAVIDELAGRLGGWALYPFGGRPFLPFLRWARRSEPLFPSPLGPLIHPRFGLWHAYRGALAFAEALVLPVPGTDRSPPNVPGPVGNEFAEHPEKDLGKDFARGFASDRVPAPAAESGPDGSPVSRSPCAGCVDRPCLEACPAGAIGAEGYDVERCKRYLVAHHDGACMTGGCLARRACPVGVEYRYAPAQAHHHMRMFVRAGRRGA